MIDNVGDLIEPLLKIVGRVVTALARAAIEITFQALPDIIVGIFNTYVDALGRRGWSGWISIPLALLLTPLTILLPLAICAAVGAGLFYFISG